MNTSKKLLTLAVLVACSSMNVAVAGSPKWTDAEKVFNTYEHDESLLQVAGYLSNWGVYDRAFNINDIKGKYDKLVYSFMGLCGSGIGDPTNTSAISSVENTCAASNYPDYTIVFTDPNSDYLADYGSGNGYWNNELNGAASFESGQEYAGGLIAVLREMKKEDPNLELAFSVGGWSLSEAFSRMASTSESRKVFIDSAVQWFTLYPMFDQIDIDWEYPGGGGASGNSWSENDGVNYALLIKELRTALTTAGMSEKKIAIAAGAPESKIYASNIKALIDNGLDTVHLMTYDLFGDWQDKLAHHTNLSGKAFENDDDFHSIEKSIDYMIDELGIPSTAIQIGYANYSRNGGDADLQSVSPLVGSFAPNTSIDSSYDPGASELFDYANKLVSFDETGASGLQGYELYTDTDANADFLFNKKTNQFLSIDTPRSVYAKAVYAKKRDLGGIFNWMVDHDPGYHINAAREGLGYRVTNTTLDMANVIKACGFIDTDKTELSEAECEQLSNPAEILKLYDISGDTPKAGQKVVTTITTLDGTVHDIVTVFDKAPVSYGWQDDVANSINQKSIDNVEAGERKQDGSVQIVQGSGYRNVVWGPVGTEVEMTILDNDIVKIGGISGDTPKAGQKVVTTITTLDGTVHDIVTVFDKAPVSYGWQDDVANSINQKSIDNVEAGERKQDGSVQIVQGSGYRNVVWGPVGSTVTMELHDID